MNVFTPHKADALLSDAHTSDLKNLLPCRNCVTHYCCTLEKLAGAMLKYEDHYQ